MGGDHVHGIFVCKPCTASNHCTTHLNVSVMKMAFFFPSNRKEHNESRVTVIN